MATGTEVRDRLTRLALLQKLGMKGEALRTFLRILQFHYGMILVSGPGRTITMYGTLHELIEEGWKKIYVIEEPVVEYRVDPDADIIVAGEIRDANTAAMAVNFALTGRLVFSTVNANSTSEAIARLIEMGMPALLLASSLVGVVAQRLAQHICQHCKVLREPSAVEALTYEQIMQEAAREFYVGEGCDLCGQTGFSGRVGIFEVLPVSEEIQRLIASGATAEKIQDKAVEEGMIPLEKAGMLKAKAGETTIEEVIRIFFPMLKETSLATGISPM